MEGMMPVSRLSRDVADYFRFGVSRSNAEKAFGSALVVERAPYVIVATNPRWNPGELQSPCDLTRIATFPEAVRGLLTLLRSDADDRSDHDRVEVLLPKSVFADVADHVGADRVADLALGVGVAAGDQVMAALQECFESLHRVTREHGDALAERLADAINTHLAERYGGMRKPPEVGSGGLAPWQLRLAKRWLNDLNATAQLEDIAGDCGLSTGHFARAFKRSTGKSPHQWALQRRIEAAKEMLGEGLPLAEIAIACRFSDQSHLTRAFSQATGTTPGRWRSDRTVRQNVALEA